MTDIVERLRWLSSPGAEGKSCSARLTEFCKVGHQAADEIERLRAWPGSFPWRFNGPLDGTSYVLPITELDDAEA